MCSSSARKASILGKLIAVIIPNPPAFENALANSALPIIAKAPIINGYFTPAIWVILVSHFIYNQTHFKNIF